MMCVCVVRLCAFVCVCVRVCECACLFVRCVERFTAGVFAWL